MSLPSNQQLANEIAKLNDKIERKHKSAMTAISTAKNELMSIIQPIHDYVREDTGYNRGLKDGRGNGVRIDKETLNIIKWLILIIGSVVGAKLV